MRGTQGRRARHRGAHVAPRVYVELPQGLDAQEWAQRHARGEAPDRTPYGLERLADHGFRVAFRRAPLGAMSNWVSGRVDPRLGGSQVLPLLRDRTPALRRGADLLLSMDERTGIPAALTSGGTAVVSGVAWLDDPAALPPLQRRTTTAALQRMAGVFTECSAMKAPLMHGFGLASEDVHVIRLGIDPEFHAPRPPAQGAPMVFSVGDDRMRDHATVIRAVERLRQQFPEIRLELGTTLPVPAAGEWLQVHARRLDGQVRDFYARCTAVAVALHPNVQGSGLTVVLEAMASARPIIVTDNPGLSDYVVHGETGLLVPPGDPGAMAAALAELLSDPERAAAMGRAGRARVEERFTTVHMTGDLAEVLRRALARHALARR